MYPYDFARLLVAALQRAGSADGAKVLIAALNEVAIAGRERRPARLQPSATTTASSTTTSTSRRFEDMSYAPVKDDPLSATLPTLDQEG